MTSLEPAAERIGRRAAEVRDVMMLGQRPGRTCELPPRGVELRNSTDSRGILDRDVGAAVRFIRDHAGVFIDVTDVLRVALVSRRALERGFREASGHGIYEAIHIVHVERAQQLLQTPDVSLTKVALGSGYHDVT